jgi:uncharacterized protein YbaP (TraB family)
MRIPGLRTALLPLAMLFGAWLIDAAAVAQDAGRRAAPAQPPVCSGRDLYAGLESENPEARRRIDAAASATANAGALLWRIERAGQPTSHLYGTVHLSDPRVNALSPATREALTGAEQVVLEVADLSAEALGGAVQRLQPLLVQTEGRSLTRDLEPKHLAIARHALEKAGMPGGALELLRPWVVTMTLALTDCERRRSSFGLRALDQAIGEDGKRRGVPVLGLETLDDQLQALAAVPDADQLTVLKATLALQHLSDDLAETLVRLYLARRLGHIWPLQAELWTAAGYPVDALASFQRELVDKRNVAMAKAALDLIERRSSFVAVGALHLPGETGLVTLLRRAGWTVTPVE